MEWILQSIPIELLAILINNDIFLRKEIITGGGLF
jgi:hypothetical protein